MRPIIAVTRRRVWLARLPTFIAAGVCSAGLAIIGTSIITNPSVQDERLLLASLTFAIADVAAVIMSLRVNRLGIFDEGFAPPVKPLTRLLSEPWILPWEDLTEVETIHTPQRAAHIGGTGLRIVSSPLRTEWLLASDRLAPWFGDSHNAERFIAVLNRIGDRLRELGRPLSVEEVRYILQEVST